MSAPQPDLPAGWRLTTFDSVDSTNEAAKRLAQAGETAGAVVWARQQTAGRGRHGRAWTSPPGNLYLSVLLRPDCPPGDAPQVGFATGVALAEAVERLTDLSVALKWPNDLTIDGKKVSGILLESAANPDGTLAWLIIGVGVNVETCPRDLPGVTCLHDEGSAVAIEELLPVFLERLSFRLRRWREQGFGAIRDRWMSYALPPGTEMRVRLPNGDIFGRFSGLDERGSLVLGTDCGPRQIDIGDVFPLPPASEGVG